MKFTRHIIGPWRMPSKNLGDPEVSTSTAIRLTFIYLINPTTITVKSCEMWYTHSW